ncbi:MAG: flagellar hook-associated protein FlgL [Rouxiella aceris]|uniref:flagellar hook-associated protein FlgL n=1 Tax=Rouxiella aceris TaxID=2703884 RepID=UPI00284C5DEE|nr:flagellar hook-associated protein FlgL [Rouxiella aceris]MDR3433069.1 flagellar hook-associated protein FlgL [Rouxiella aceris]
MRLSTNMIYTQNMSGVLNNQSLMQESALELSTGQKVNKPSDNPLAASQAVMINQSQAQNSQYTLARTFANQSLSEQENVLSSVTSTIQEAQSVIVQAGDGTLSDDDRASLGTKLQGLKDQLVNLANSTDGNGRYIFGGYQTNTAPFSVDATTGAVTYVGGSTPITQQVDANRTMTIENTGSQVFDSLTSDAVAEPDGSASEANVFTTLDTAITALNTPKASFANDTDYTDAIDKANRGLRNSLNNVLSVRSSGGTSLSELDTLDSLGSDRNLTNSTILSSLVDTDWTSAISDYSLQQVALQASYKTFSSMSQMSLFQMNR